jgi:precorrin-6B C5,15-methyltransferase / cobalt-precorrin-6B C5,C15-methyltransferase
MKWLTIIGMGEDGYAGLSPSARQSLASAQHIVGSQRLLGFLPVLQATRHEWPQPFSAVVQQITPLRGQPTVILATGDPMNYGAARKLLEFLPFEEMTIIPHLSAFSLGASRMGWSLPDCDCFTIHGRPAANLEAFIQPDAKLLVLTQDASSIAECARRLVARGFETSALTVLENMGGERETQVTFTANAVASHKWSDLNTLAIHCIASPHAKIWSRVPGLPDDVFKHDGKITKPEVRAATIAALAPSPDQILWDIGAGSGSIAIEWMRSTRGCEAYAIEHDDEQCSFIAANADQLGTPRLKIIKGQAPAAIKDLPMPHAIFIGGGLSDDGVFDAAWERLRQGGRLVANVVTLEGQQRLFDLQKTHGGELVSMDVSVLTHVGDMRAMRPRMAVMQWRVRKP